MKNCIFCNKNIHIPINCTNPIYTTLEMITNSWWIDIICSLCYNDYMRVYPLTVNMIYNRQLTGKFN
jgi:hypothetical protein